LDLYLLDIIGSECIGVYTLVTDKIIIIPKFVSLSKAKKISELLKVRLIHSTIGDSVLAGALSCANSNGILLPRFVGDKEIKAIKPFFKGNIAIMETKKTAYGNLVLANDFGAVVDPSFTSDEIKKISETLAVDVVPGKIANLPYVGSLAVATNTAVLAHPLLQNGERKILEDVLKVPTDTGTVNCGVPHIGTGLICNSNGAITGTLTTGPEMFIIENVFQQT
jgi:translation initiation factor 6